jgi:hypothetical protein
VSEKAKQLKAVQALCGVFTGFSFTVLTNLTIKSTLDTVLLILVGSAACVVICSMLVALVVSAYTLVGVYRFKYNALQSNTDVHQTHTDFKSFWDLQCDTEWRISLSAFEIGMFPDYLVSIIEYSLYISRNVGIFIFAYSCDLDTCIRKHGRL